MNGVYNEYMTEFCDKRSAEDECKMRDLTGPRIKYGVTTSFFATLAHQLNHPQLRHRLLQILQ